MTLGKSKQNSFSRLMSVLLKMSTASSFTEMSNMKLNICQSVVTFTLWNWVTRFVKIGYSVRLVICLLIFAKTGHVKWPCGGLDWRNGWGGWNDKSVNEKLFPWTEQIVRVDLVVACTVGTTLLASPARIHIHSVKQLCAPHVLHRENNSTWNGILSAQ